jgi:hypothetical protein
MPRLQGTHLEFKYKSLSIERASTHMIALNSVSVPKVLNPWWIIGGLLDA